MKICTKLKHVRIKGKNIMKLTKLMLALALAVVASTALTACDSDDDAVSSSFSVSNSAL